MQYKGLRTKEKILQTMCRVVDGIHYPGKTWNINFLGITSMAIAQKLQSIYYLSTLNCRTSRLEVKSASKIHFATLPSIFLGTLIEKIICEHPSVID